MYTIAKTCYYQAVTESANFQVFLIKHQFYQGIPISPDLKVIASQKMEAITRDIFRAEENLDAARTLLRDIQKIDETNACRTKITPSITEMQVVKSV